MFWIFKNNKKEFIFKKPTLQIIEKIKKYSQEKDVVEKDVLTEYYIVQTLKILKSCYWDNYFVLKWWSAMCIFHWFPRTSKDIDIDFSVEMKNEISEKEKEKMEKDFEEIFWNFSTFKIKKYESGKIKYEIVYEDEIFWNILVWFDIKFNQFLEGEQNKITPELQDVFDEKEFTFSTIKKSQVFASKILAFWQRVLIKDVIDIIVFLKKFEEIDKEFMRKENELDVKFNRRRENFFYLKEYDLENSIRKRFENNFDKLNYFDDFKEYIYQLHKNERFPFENLKMEFENALFEYFHKLNNEEDEFDFILPDEEIFNPTEDIKLQKVREILKNYKKALKKDFKWEKITIKIIGNKKWLFYQLWSNSNTYEPIDEFYYKEDLIQHIYKNNLM